jgi:hypothetical protein
MKAGKTTMAATAAAALVAVFFALVIAPAAGKPTRTKSPKAPKTFFGIVPLEDPAPSDLARMAGGGVDTIRLLLRWGAAEEIPGVYDWSTYDTEIGNVAAAGLIPHVQFASSPPWISSNPSQPPIYSDLQKTAWTNFLAAFMQRYGRGGSFWREHPELRSDPVTSMEIWNEPNLNIAWGGPPNPDEYFVLLQISQRAIEQVDPATKIVLGGLFPAPPPYWGMMAARFLRGLYAHPAARSMVDVLSLHPYSASVADVVPTCRKFRTLLRRLGVSQTPLWITEIGWSTGGVGFSRNPYRTTERQQAVKLARSFTALIRARKMLRLQRIFWHDWRDSPGRNTETVYQMGLLRADGSAKPSWRAYQRLARR